MVMARCTGCGALDATAAPLSRDCGDVGSTFTVGALVLRHNVEHAAVGLDRVSGRRSPSIT
ncbi:MAG TPA: hypothetical protein VIX84_23720, partial [Acidimicrobiales bacterium]